MKIYRIISKSRILTDICVIRLKIKIKNNFSDIVSNIFVVRKSCNNIKMFV